MKSIYDDDYVNLIAALRAIRLERHITQSQLASALNVTQSFVSKVENRDRRLDVVELLSWVDALGVSLGEVLPAEERGGRSGWPL